MSMFN